ncbi:hypothetical protein F5Y12DRAFT_716386 [Xylaria sp. FL1777]|nr:hypothetical protein F5Y12DRAFT_716386 [Xylaria sp. FL1777]
MFSIKQWKGFSSKPKTKSRNYRANRLNGVVDSELVKDAATPIQYWSNIVNRHPIRKTLSVKEVMENLATIPPHRQPSETQLYTQVKKELEAISREREELTFELPERSLKIPTREEIEALRIYGSAEHGFGTLPNAIEYLLTQTGTLSFL